LEALAHQKNPQNQENALQAMIKNLSEKNQELEA
jgi:hypothetical protein